MKLRVAKKIRSKILERWFEPNSPSLNEIAREFGYSRYQVDKVTKRLKKYWAKNKKAE